MGIVLTSGQGQYHSQSLRVYAAAKGNTLTLANERGTLQRRQGANIGVSVTGRSCPVYHVTRKAGVFSLGERLDFLSSRFQFARL